MIIGNYTILKYLKPFELATKSACHYLLLSSKTFDHFITLSTYEISILFIGILVFIGFVKRKIGISPQVGRWSHRNSVSHRKYE